MLRLATRAPGLGDPPAMRRIYRLGQGVPDRMTPAREKVLEVLRDYGGLAFTLRELAEMAGVSTGVVKGLAAQGAVLEEDSPRDLPFPTLDPAQSGKTLNEDQAAAADALRAAVARGTYGTTLLRGVTGSGKTEVYLEAVAEALRQGRQALVLLPEIALTAEFLTRVEARFGARPAEWHSGVTVTERRRIWRMVAEGGAQLVVGARSALFLPYRDLGLIVVDEEHDTSYKQEDGVLYNARDMAVLRAAICGARVVLASATPSLESWANAEAGKYDKLVLTDRFGAAVLPEMRAIDMRAETLADEPLDLADLAGGGDAADQGRRAGAAVHQPARLCADHGLPCLRASDRLRSLRRADGGASFPQASGLPSMRRDETHARGLPRPAVCRASWPRSAPVWSA